MGASVTGLFAPKILEVAGVPEIFCDLAVVKGYDDTVRFLLARKTMAQDWYEQVGSLFMPRSSFEISREWARAIWHERHH